MGSEYVTIARRGQGSYEEKRSRFLGEAVPVHSAEEVNRELNRIRKETWDARHHCYAYVLGADREQKRSSDDGEPSGTAGAPILSVLEQAGCTDTLLVVTRYFGGVLLGTGGLVRAYTRAASEALKDAGTVRMQEGVILHVTLPYSLYDKLLYQLGQLRLEPQNPGFGAEVSFDLTVPVSMRVSLEQLFASAGNGLVKVTQTESGYFPFR